MSPKIPFNQADLHLGHTYFLERADGEGESILGRIISISVPTGNLINFEIIALDPGLGDVMRDMSFPVRIDKGNPCSIQVTEVSTDELACYVHLPYKNPAFDRAVRGEP